jgi:hypothetical protein
MSGAERVLILTPLKDAAHHADAYWHGIDKLTYPRDRISLGFLESDSNDRTHALFADHIARRGGAFRSAALFKRDFGFRIPDDQPRYAHHLQVQRRSTLAKSRNHLLFRALDDEDWVLWLDVDVIDYPADIVERLLAYGKDVVHPNCVREYGGPSFDLNAWRKRGKLHLHDLKREGELVRLDSVGGTMLLVRADVHRDGLVFPSYPYGLHNPKIRKRNHWRGELETEGFGIMADDMGVECWGLPHLEIKHHPE